MVITTSILDDAFAGYKLPILNFNGSQINLIQGFFRMTAHFNGYSCPVSIYINDDNCELVIS